MRMRVALWLIIATSCGRQTFSNFDASVWDFDRLDAAVEFSDTVTSSSCWSRPMVIGPFSENTPLQTPLAQMVALPDGDALVIWTHFTAYAWPNLYARRFHSDGGVEAPVVVWSAEQEKHWFSAPTFSVNASGEGIVSWIAGSDYGTELKAMRLDRDGGFRPATTVSEGQIFWSSTSAVLPNGDAVLAVRQRPEDREFGDQTLIAFVNKHDEQTWSSDVLTPQARSGLGFPAIGMTGNDAFIVWISYGFDDPATRAFVARREVDAGWVRTTLGPTNTVMTPVIATRENDARIFWVSDEAKLSVARSEANTWSVDGGTPPSASGWPVAAIATPLHFGVSWHLTQQVVASHEADGGWTEPATLATVDQLRGLTSWVANRRGDSLALWGDFWTLSTTRFDSNLNAFASQTIDGLQLSDDYTSLSNPIPAVNDDGNLWLLGRELDPPYRLVLMHCR